MSKAIATTDGEVDTDTVSVTRTIKCFLESSNRKNEKLKEAIDEFQQAVAYYNAHIPSLPEYQWNRQNSHLYRMGTRDLEFNIRAKLIQNAVNESVAAFKSWRENGRENKPTGSFGDYVNLTSQGYTIEENNSGFGFKANLIPYKPEWWHLNVGSYQREFLDRAINGDASFGSTDIFYNDGNPFVNITVSWDVAVNKPNDVTTAVGVDLGENVIYAAAVEDLQSDDTKAVELENGAEFRHHRERLSERKDKLQKQGDLKGVKETRNERRKYTEQVTHRVAKEIVGLAVAHEPAVIRLEDLTHYRERATNAIHDWPYAEIQEKVCYKATENGIPVEKVDPRYTSQTCSECGHQDSSNRSGVDFQCGDCGYEIHADANAAMNIARTL